jgi:hypothetical protein
LSEAANQVIVQGALISKNRLQPSCPVHMRDCRQDTQLNLFDRNNVEHITRWVMAHSLRQLKICLRAFRKHRRRKRSVWPRNLISALTMSFISGFRGSARILQCLGSFHGLILLWMEASSATASSPVSNWCCSSFSTIASAMTSCPKAEKCGSHDSEK